MIGLFFFVLSSGLRLSPKTAFCRITARFLHYPTKYENVSQIAGLLVDLVVDGLSIAVIHVSPVSCGRQDNANLTKICLTAKKLRGKCF